MQLSSRVLGSDAFPTWFQNVYVFNEAKWKRNIYLHYTSYEISRYLIFYCLSAAGNSPDGGRIAFGYLQQWRC